MTSYTCKLESGEARALERYLHERGYEFRDVPHARFAAERDKVNVVFYQSGKLVVQGKGTRDFVEFVLEPEILKRVGLGYELELNPEQSIPRIGVDESGKGDLFGPLCVAAVYVNREVASQWRDAGIRDSKTIGTARRVAELAALIRSTPGCVAEVVSIGNEAYNRLHAKLGNVNAILAWGHARAIENLLAQSARLKPPPERAISDQFASDKRRIESALMPLGRSIELVQRHKAESDWAVAAASILARHEFLDRLDRLGKRYDCVLPKGAGPAADEALAGLVTAHGPDIVGRITKAHFRNTFKYNALRPKRPGSSA